MNYLGIIIASRNEVLLILNDCGHDAQPSRPMTESTSAPSRPRGYKEADWSSMIFRGVQQTRPNCSPVRFRGRNEVNLLGQLVG